MYGWCKFESMKKRRKQAVRLHDRFLSSCGSCGKPIEDDQEVFSASAKVLPGIDLSGKEGQVIELSLLRAGRTVLAAVAGRDSQARREGKELLFLCCSVRCAQDMTAALQNEIDYGKELGLR
jgi:hypothetical protein